MYLKLFTDLIAALGKVVGSLKAIVNLPKAKRETMRWTLGDTLLYAADDDFLREVARFDDYNVWMRAEREFRLYDWKGLHV